MAQVSYGSITISDITDISNIYFEYCLTKIGTSAEDLKDVNYFYNYSLTVDTSCQEGKKYFTRELVDETYIYTEVISPTGDPSQFGYYEREQKDFQEVDWSIIYPTWAEGYNVWTRQVEQFKDKEQLTYGEPYLDSAVNQLSQTVKLHDINLNALDTRTNYFWYNLIEETSDYQIGAYAASGIEGIPFDREDYRTYGYNTLLQHNNIYFRYNEANMTAIGQNGVNLYYTPLFTYTPTSDETISDDKIYYGKTTVDNIDHFYPIAAPNVEEISSYYELSISELNQKGLELTKEGLFLYSKPGNHSYEYKLTTDTICVSNKNYYEATINEGNTTYISIVNPSGNPNQQGWYERVEKDLKVVELTEYGVKIKNGSIYIGDSVENPSNATSGSIALTQSNFSRNIGGTTVDNLRFAIGDNFGVTADGVLYATGGAFFGGSLDDYYTKEAIDSTLQSYLLTEDAEENYMKPSDAINEIQIIYIATEATIDTLDVSNLDWITSVGTNEGQWTLIQPSYTTNNIYTAIQFKDNSGKVTTTNLTQGAPDLNSLFINGQITKDNLNLNGINLGDLSGQITQGQLDSTVVYNTISNQVSNAISTTIDSEIENCLTKTDIDINVWKSLSQAIEIVPNDTEPHISIVSVKGDGTFDKDSYLYLSGKTIQFVVGGTDGALKINNNSIETKDVHAQSVFMYDQSRLKCFGWIVRSDGHMGLKKMS